MKLTLVFDQFLLNNELMTTACFLEIPGMVVSGPTEEEAFDELMVSLRVKILHDNNLQL